MELKGEELSFRYGTGGRQLLDRFSLTVESGEVVGLSAPSGVGKTTLCRILAGYLPPQGGTVTLEGKPLGAYRGYCPVQLVWQHPELAVNPRLRLRETLLEGGDLSRRVLDALGIQPAWLERYPGELSGGELQRFCIARALGEATRFLLADEISAMLDLITQAQLWGFLLEEARQRDIGLLVVSHAEGLLERLCTRRVRLPALPVSTGK